MKRPASDKYQLTIEPGVYHVYKFGKVDLRSLTVEQADILFKKGFPYLKLIPPEETEVVKAPKVKKLRNTVS